MWDGGCQLSIVLMSSGLGMANTFRDWIATYVYIDVC